MTTSSNPKEKSRWGKQIVVPAIWESFVKLNPRTLAKNPVMFVVEVGAVLTSVDLIRGLVHGAGGFGFSLQITLWLWFTVLFANFAEAMAEGRGKAQAETLRKARSETIARRIKADGSIESVPGSVLRSGDFVMIAASEFVPGDHRRIRSGNS
jgi:K+-transporting ATPase ATPase B chain